MNYRACLMLAIAAVMMSTVRAQSDRFTLGIVRLDGRIVPFAAYDRGRWERAWAEADEQIDPAPTLDNIESVWSKRGEGVPTIWHVWRVLGGGRIEAQVKGLEVVEAHCGGQVALTTGLPQTTGDHWRKLGVAVDSTIPIKVIEEVRRADPMWKAAQQLVSANFAKLELAQAEAGSKQLPREMPAAVALISELYREVNSPRSPMYFIAEKKYRTLLEPRNAKCNVRSIMTGWLLPSPSGGWALREHRMFVTDCDASDARDALPLAALNVAGQNFWVLQEHGYEDETYIVAEIDASGVRYVIDVSGGGC
jgi:hypothetical protein